MLTEFVVLLGSRYALAGGCSRGVVLFVLINIVFFVAVPAKIKRRRTVVVDWGKYRAAGWAPPDRRWSPELPSAPCMTDSYGAESEGAQAVQTATESH